VGQPKQGWFRDKRHLAILEANSIGLNEARVALMLQDVTKNLMTIVDETILAAYERWKSTYAFNLKHPDREAHRELEKEWQSLRDGIEQLRAEALRVLGGMEKPI